MVAAVQVYVGSDGSALEAMREGLDGNVSSGGGAAYLHAMLAVADAGAALDIFFSPFKVFGSKPLIL